MTTKSKVNHETGEIVPVGVRPVLRAAYDDHAALSDGFGLACLDESLADQSGKEEADINTLVRRFGLTGQLPTDVRAPTFGDFTGVSDFREAMDAVLAAQASFMAMPAEVRQEFGHSPQRFVEFCSDEANFDRMCELGLIAPEPMRKRVEERKAKEAAELASKVDAEIARRGGVSDKSQGAVPRELKER